MPQFVPIAPCPVAGHHWKELGFVPTKPSLNEPPRLSQQRTQHSPAPATAFGCVGSILQLACRAFPERSPVQACSRLQTRVSARHLSAQPRAVTGLEQTELPGARRHPASLRMRAGPRAQMGPGCWGPGTARSHTTKECLESTWVSWDDTSAELRRKPLTARGHQRSLPAYSSPHACLCEATTPRNPRRSHTMLRREMRAKG